MEKKTVKLRPYRGERPTAQRREIYVPGVSKTDESFAEECDVNFIMDKFTKGEEIKHVRKNAGVYADVSQIPDLAEAFAIVDHANAAFMTLPAEIREALGNEPANLEGFVQNPHNQDLLLKYGLVEQKQTVETPSTVSAPAQPATPAPTPTPATK